MEKDLIRIIEELNEIAEKLEESGQDDCENYITNAITLLVQTIKEIKEI